MKKELILCITFCLWETVVFAGSDPVLTGAISISPSGTDWFHIGDGVTLTASGEDCDCGDGSNSDPAEYLKSGTTSIYANFIDLANTTWSGSTDLSETTGASVTWTPQSPDGLGVVISAVIDDDASRGYGNDSPITKSTPRLKAYRVGVDISRNWSSDNMYASPTTSDDDETDMSFWEDDSNATESFTDGLGHYMTASDDEEKHYRQKSINFKYTLRTDPTTADLGSNRVKTVITATDNEATIEGTVRDVDWNDGSSSISIGFSAGVAGVSSTITFGSDENDGYAAGGWAFTGDEFSDLNSNATQLYSLKSGDYDEKDLPKTAYAYGSVDQEVDFIGLDSDPLESRYEVEGHVKCIEKSGYAALGVAETSRTGTYSCTRPVLHTP